MLVNLMTLEAKKWLILPEKIIGNSSVGFMTYSSIFNNRSMLKDKWSLLVGMAIEAKIVSPLKG